MRFVRDYGKIAKPLTELLKKGQFIWLAQVVTTMAALKEAITIAPVLALPDFKQQFHIDCDASGNDVGAILTQNKNLIAFFIEGTVI